MKWALVLTNQAARGLRRASRDDRNQLRAVLHELCNDPYSGDIKLLKGTHGSLRRRVGDWRLLFDLQTEHHLIVVTDIVRRGSHTY
jgi:mRNA-degrading endonuclease RelE of RelBE toxin-antitoxin system